MIDFSDSIIGVVIINKGNNIQSYGYNFCLNDGKECYFWSDFENFIVWVDYDSVFYRVEVWF